MSRILIAGLAFIILAPGWLAAPAARGESPTALKLLERGDLLADEKRYEQALIAYKEAYEQILPGLRSLPFVKPVEPRLMKRAALQQYLVEELARTMTEKEIRFMDLTVQAFGVAPPGADIKQLLISLYTEEVAGFYDTDRKAIFLITEDQRKPGLFDALLGRSAFDKEEQKTTLSHEMTHALADQHFELSKLDGAMKGNEDGQLAISALVEGEATLVMFAEMTRTGAGSPELATEIPPERVDRMFRMLGLVSSFSSGRAYRQAPPFFRKSLIFPYHRGTVFVAELASRGGWKAVNRAFYDPPLSTEQILHPEKYLAPERDVPLQPELPDVGDLLPEWRRLDEDTFGEFQTSLILDELPHGRRASEGWGGDRYVIFEPTAESPSGSRPRPALLWFTVWDSPGDAVEFWDAYSQRVRQLPLRRRPAKRYPPWESWPETTADADQQIMTWNGQTYLMQRQDRKVVIVEGLESTQQARQVSQRLLDQTRVRPLRFRVAPWERR